MGFDFVVMFIASLVDDILYGRYALDRRGVLHWRHKMAHLLSFVGSYIGFFGLLMYWICLRSPRILGRTSK
jgi:hypothetical protein